MTFADNRKKLVDLASAHPNLVIAGSVVLAVGGFKIGFRKPPVKLVDPKTHRFITSVAELTSYVENGFANSGDLAFDNAYSKGAWWVADELKSLLNGLE